MARTPTEIAAEKARTCCVVLTKRCMRDFMRFLTKYNVGSGEATRHSRRLEARCFGGVRFRWNQMRLADEVSTFNITLQPLSILFETALRRSVRACSPAAPYRSSTASWRPLMDPRASCSPRMPSNPSFARAGRLRLAVLYPSSFFHVHAQMHLRSCARQLKSACVLTGIVTLTER